MTDEDVIRRCHAATEMGVVSIRPEKGVRKQVWRWEVHHKRDVARVLCAMAPLLGERRRRKVVEAAERLQSVRTQRREVEHGTNSGYQWHQRKSIPPCDACIAAKREFNHAGYVKRKAEGYYG